MQIDRYSSAVFSDKVLGQAAMIQDWYDLAVAINVKPQTLSYALRNRDALQTEIRIKDRVVYNSGPSLKKVQEKLIPFFKDMYSQVDTGPMLAYIKGKDPRLVLREECTGAKYEVLVDIRKYYDHVTFKHLVDMLRGFGMSEKGAKLVTRYCVVRRSANGKQISTLQQGSPCSPILSNLVGAIYFDQPIMAWLREKAIENPRMTYRYCRYSDNLALFLDGEIPLDFVKEYQRFVSATLHRARFQGHKGQVIPHNHPKRNQKFLGIVLNSVARIEKEEYQRLRAMLFNACKDGLGAAAYRYWSENEHKFLQVETRWGHVPEEFKIEKFLQVLQGNIAYVHSVNPEHALKLKKLLEAAKLLRDQPMNPTGRLFNAVKTYKQRESLEVYLNRVGLLLNAGSVTTTPGTEEQVAI